MVERAVPLHQLILVASPGDVALMATSPFNSTIQGDRSNIVRHRDRVKENCAIVLTTNTYQ